MTVPSESHGDDIQTCHRPASIVRHGPTCPVPSRFCPLPHAAPLRALTAHCRLIPRACPRARLEGTTVEGRALQGIGWGLTVPAPAWSPATSGRFSLRLASLRLTDMD